MLENLLPTYNKNKVLLIERGEKCRLFDDNGNSYLDMFAGVAVSNLGHNNKLINISIINQSKQIIHISNYFYSKNEMELSYILASKVKHILPDARIFFCNSGTEANETALKFSILETGNKKNILSFINGFHGRTMGSLSMTHNLNYRNNFSKHLNSNVYFHIFNDLDFEKIILDKNIGIIIIEVIQGEGGVNIASHEFCNKITELQQKYSLTLIIDEVQTGIGRCGTFYAFEKYGLKPDFITTAKALGNGYPIGAVICKKSFNIQYGQHGSTFGGNPLATSVSISVLNQINEDLMDSVKQKGEFLMNELNLLKNEYSFIKDVRGVGLLIGIQFDERIEVASIIEELLFDFKILCISANHNVLRLCPPLIITYEEMDFFIKSITIICKKIKFRSLVELNKSNETLCFIQLDDIENKYKLWNTKMKNIELFYAVKCNPDEEIIKHLAKLGASFDCASQAEIELVLRTNTPLNKIIYANPIKKIASLKYNCMMTFDNIDELHKIKKYQKTAPLLLRIKGNEEYSNCKFNSKFGADLNDVIELLKTAKKLDLNVIGISFHNGSGCQSSIAYEKSIRNCYDVFIASKNIGFNFSIIDIGGGFSSLTNFVSFDKIAITVNNSIEKYFGKNNALRIIAEVGRFMVETSHTHVVQIIGKRNDKLYVSDGLYGSFNNMMFDHQLKLDLHPLNIYKNCKKQETVIFGPTCDSLDNIGNYELPEMNLDDYLIIFNTGAYTLASASEFNGIPLPKKIYI